MIATEKMINILELFLNNYDELSLSEISNLTGLHKTTVYRIASLLVQRSYLERQGKGGKYSLGLRFLDFSAIIKSRIKIRDVAIRYLDKLRQDVKESCALVLWDGKRAILVDTVDYNAVLKAAPIEMSKPPLHATSSGKIFLASMSETEFDKYIKSIQLKKYATNTITDPVKLKKECKLVRAQGFAYDIDEYIEGISGIAVGLINNKGKTLGAIHVVGPTIRLTRTRMKSIVPKLIKVSQEIMNWVYLRES